MWICPRCRQRFCNRNQTYSCGNISVKNFLAGKSSEGIGLFTLHPVKTRVTLAAQMRFCSINRVGRDFLDVHFVHTRVSPDGTSIRRMEKIDYGFFLHHLRFRNPLAIDPDVKTIMRLAYDVGNRTHRKTPR